VAQGRGGVDFYLDRKGDEIFRRTFNFTGKFAAGAVEHGDGHPPRFKRRTCSA